MKKSLIVLSLCFLFVFCDSNKDSFYYENKEINKPWNKDSILDFEIEIKDININYDIYIVVRNNNDYPYGNLFLFVGIYNDTTIIREDTLQYIMASPDGKWMGQGITNIKKSIFLYDTDVKFNKKAKYIIKLKQGMRIEELEGLVSVSLILRKKII